MATQPAAPPPEAPPQPSQPGLPEAEPPGVRAAGRRCRRARSAPGQRSGNRTGATSGQSTTLEARPMLKPSQEMDSARGRVPAPRSEPGWQAAAEYLRPEWDS